MLKRIGKMDKNKKMIIGILTAAIVLVVAFIVYITCFDSHIEFSSKFKNGITVEYGKKFEVPKIKAYVRGRLINRKGKEIKCFKKIDKVDNSSFM